MPEIERGESDRTRSCTMFNTMCKSGRTSAQRLLDPNRRRAKPKDDDALMTKPFCCTIMTNLASVGPQVHPMLISSYQLLRISVRCLVMLNPPDQVLSRIRLHVSTAMASGTRAKRQVQLARSRERATNAGKTARTVGLDHVFQRRRWQAPAIQSRVLGRRSSNSRQ